MERREVTPGPRAYRRPMNTTQLITTTPPDFSAGRPRRSAPIRAIARPFGRIANRVAGTRVFPLWGIVRHTGRTSGKRYATPVVVRPTPDGFLIPLPFGDATQWAKNLFAAGGGSIRFAGREHAIHEPRIVDLETASAHLPLPIRFASRRLGLREWVMVRTVGT
jgi:deazaflavin-dependent oxidoreductase (nitroreductase family)